MAPERFGKFSIHESLAIGGMAEVHLVSLPGTPGRLALKRMRPEYAEEPEFLSMFIDEASVLTQLRHPNIVEVMDLGIIGGRYFIAMEYVDGQSLSQLSLACRRAGRIIPLPSALYVAREVCWGLSFAHECTDDAGHPLGIVHRDISPPNVMLSWDGCVKIIDFGVAKASHRVSSTRAGTLKGKFSYMSPEQARGEEVDFHTDLFALGIVLYEMVTSESLFSADSEIATLVQVQRCQLEHATPRLMGMSSPLQELLLRALAPDPRDRFTSAREMEQVLTSLLLSEEEGRSALVQLIWDVLSPVFPDGRVAAVPTKEEPTTASGIHSTAVRARKGKVDGSAPGGGKRVVLEIKKESDVFQARRMGQRMAAELGMSTADAVSVATVISELTRNVVKYAGQGTLQIDQILGEKRGLRIVINDRGPGIPAVDAVMARPRPSRLGMGMGLIGARRLMDEFSIETRLQEGTMICAVKYL